MAKTIIITLEDTANEMTAVPLVKRLALLLKRAKRDWGLRCVSIKEVKSKSAIESQNQSERK